MKRVARTAHSSADSALRSKIATGLRRAGEERPVCESLRDLDHTSWERDTAQRDCLSVIAAILRRKSAITPRSAEV